MKNCNIITLLFILCVISSSFASGPFNTLKKADKLVTNCMVDCFDKCPQEIILLMLEKCEKGCMKGKLKRHL